MSESKFRALLEQRIAILDGAMGTMIQTYKLEEKDFRGEQFAGHPCEVKGLLTSVEMEAVRFVGPIAPATMHTRVGSLTITESAARRAACAPATLRSYTTGSSL